MSMITRKYRLDEATEIMNYMEADIDNAVELAEQEQYTTAVNLLVAITRDLERVIKTFPQFEGQAKPLVAKATTLTLQIINRSTR